MAALAEENVQEYPRPPRLEPVGAVLRVVFAGETIAETERGWRVLETHHAPSYYIPPEDVRQDLLRPAGGGSFCEWKGRARYWDVVVGDRTAEAGSWSYDRPSNDFAPLARHHAFYARMMEACFVGDIRVTPQPGGFYGGWVTPNLTGTIKGAPGTEGW